MREVQRPEYKGSDWVMSVINYNWVLSSSLPGVGGVIPPEPRRVYLAYLSHFSNQVGWNKYVA